MKNSSASFFPKDIESGGKIEARDERRMERERAGEGGERDGEIDERQRVRRKSYKTSDASNWCRHHRRRHSLLHSSPRHGQGSFVLLLFFRYRK